MPWYVNQGAAKDNAKAGFSIVGHSKAVSTTVKRED